MMGREREREGGRVNKPHDKGMSTNCGGEQRRHWDEEGGRGAGEGRRTLLQFQAAGSGPRSVVLGVWQRGALSGRGPSREFMVRV